MGEWNGNENSTVFGDGVNWDAMSHQQLWDWFARTRTESMSGAVQVWMDNVGSRFQAAADMVNEALATAGVHWEGAAADSMRESSAPLASHALVAKDAATSVGQTTINQVFAASQMAHAIPEPKPAPQQKDLLPMVGSPAMVQHLMDVHEQEKAASEAEARARDLARTYDAGADEAVGGLPRFEKAPQATVTKAEPGATIEVPDPRPGGPGPGGDSGPGIGSGPGYTSAGPDGTSSPAGVIPQDGRNGGDGVRPGATSGQSWTSPTSNPNGGLPIGPGAADAARPTSTGPAPGLVVLGSPGGSTGGVPGGGRPGQMPGGAAPGERLGAGGRAVPGEGVAARGGVAPAGRGTGTGMAPMGGGRGKSEEDTERNSPEYLRAYNDEFWDDTPPVAPAVIGDDEDE